jgi:hypothetical protein
VGKKSHMPDEHPLTLRQAGHARTDFAVIKAELEAIHAQFTHVASRADLAARFWSSAGRLLSASLGSRRAGGSLRNSRHDGVKA